MQMTFDACIKKYGRAYGVLEENGDLHWYPTWFEGELERYKIVQTPERKAEMQAKRMEALAKGRANKKAKKAEIERKKSTQCPSCKHSLAICVCPMKENAK